MAEPKPFASLSSGLLARKGAARPAMRPQGFGAQSSAGLEDLGWDDMGFEPPKAADAPRDASHDAFGEDVVEHPRAHPTGLTPVHSPVHSQQAEIADRLASEDEDEIDEEFDETAELYDPEAEAASELEVDEQEESEPALGAFDPEVEAAPHFEVGEQQEREPALEAYEPEAEAAPEPFQPEAEAASEPYEPQVATWIEEPAFEPSVRAVKPAVAAVTPNPAPRRAPKARSAPGGKSKSAFTLRLDPSRHLKLRLACAVNGRSAQQIVTAALDELLQNMPELETMAQSAKREA